LHSAKDLGHVYTILLLILFLINTFLQHIIHLYPNCLLCLSLEIYRRHLVIQNGGQRYKKRWKLFTKKNVVKLPNGKKVFGCKWVFTIKHKANGSVERFKAKLVAKGFTQTYGIDYEETFAQVAKMNSIRVLLSIVANLDWPLYQFDVKNTFLHGDLEEKVYMEIAPGLEDSSSVGKECKLKKALYGLTQSPRAWFERFFRAMQRFGYKQSQANHALFIKHSSQ